MSAAVVDRESNEHLFAQLLRIRRAARRLLGHEVAEADGGDPQPAEQLGRRLPRFAALFGLEPIAVDALLCLVAAEFDPLLRLVQRSVQRDVGRPWLEVGTIAELLEIPAPEIPRFGRLFAPTGALRRFSLVTVDDEGEAPLVSTRLKVTRRVAEHLAGVDELPDDITIVARGDGERALNPALVERVAGARARREGLIVEVIGSAGAGRRRWAAELAEAMGAPLVVLDLERSPAPSAIAAARREARLAGGLLCLANWTASLPAATSAATGESAASAPAHLPRAWSRLFDELDEPLVLTSDRPEPLLACERPIVVSVRVPFSSPAQRAAQLAGEIARAGGQLSPSVDVDATARRFALGRQRLARAAREAVELAALEGGAAVEARHLTSACTRQLRHDLDSVATRVTATHSWGDLVIPADVFYGLEEMVGYMRHATRVYDTWGFGARHSLTQGLSALFTGPPGTGKTMCASVIARELDMELFRVDLSRVVSKWIGETEKNLGKVFDEAERSNGIVLFDEADSLFAKRTEVKSSNDRYANLEVNYLLQRMEAFRGVTILTTNLEDTIDSAFKRRLTFRFRFEKPDAEARAALWSKMFPSHCELTPDFDPVQLGVLFEMSGANIRNAAVRAAFLAASSGTPVTQALCVLAAERECSELGLLVRSRVTIVDSDPRPFVSPGSPPPPAVTPTRPAAPPRIVPVTHRRA